MLAQHSDVAVDARTGQVFVVGSEPFGAIYVCAAERAGIFRTTDPPIPDEFTTYPSSRERCENAMNATGQFPALDRPWLTHRPPRRAHPHHDLFLVASSTGGLVASNVAWLSRDGGQWQPLGDPLIAGGAPPGTTTIVPAGQPAIAPNGDLVHVMLTQEPEKPHRVQVRLARLHNAGEPNQTWKLNTVYEFRCDSCAMSDIEPFASVAVDGDSNLYVLFVHDIPLDGDNGSDRQFHPYLWSSTDHGENWSKIPKKLNHDGYARALPAMLGGTRAGQLMIGWYRSTNSIEQCNAGARWHFEVVTSTDATSDNPQFQSTRLRNSDTSDKDKILHDDIVHYGGIHLRDRDCNIALGDFASIAYDRHGCAVVAYADDHKGPIENLVARQTSGCFGDLD